MPTDDLERFCCQNADCDLYGRRGAGNLLVCGHFGKTFHRLLYCNARKARFSEFKGTPLFNSKLPHDKALAVLEHLAEGCGVRQTARLLRVGKDTVTRLARLAGSTRRPPTTSWWPFPPETREVQLDEKWSFVAKKQEHCDPGNPDDDQCGDYWDHVAFDPEHRLVLAVVPGARTIENAEAIITEVRDRLGDGPPELVTSDEYPAYESAIEAAFSVPVVSPARRRRGLPVAGGHKTSLRLTWPKTNVFGQVSLSDVLCPPATGRPPRSERSDAGPVMAWPINAGPTPSSPRRGSSVWNEPTLRPVNPLGGETINRRAVCGRSARTVRRGEGPNPIGPS